jgi:serine/threonine protein kinase
MLVMEYAGGGELYNYVAQRQRLGEAETCRLFHQIVSGVEYCHRAKVIHRDLKLENILLDKGGNVKIADFGLSNSIKFGQKMDTNCGTPSYTCPEQISNKKYVGSAADIWSMGVILFSMVCGFLPFEAPSIPALFRRIRHRLFKTPDYISKGIPSINHIHISMSLENISIISSVRYPLLCQQRYVMPCTLLGGWCEWGCWCCCRGCRFNRSNVND